MRERGSTPIAGASSRPETGSPRWRHRLDAIDTTRTAIAAVVEADQAVAQAEHLHATAVEAAEAEAVRRSFADLDEAAAAILDDDAAG